MSPGCSILVGGEELSPSWDGSNLVALDDLMIQWGRDDPYVDTPAGTLKMSVIDPTGLWATAVDRGGQEVVVRRTGTSTRVQFRGRITTVAIDRTEVRHPDTFAVMPVWRVDLTATDTLGELAGAIIQGPSAAESIEGAGGWPVDYSGNRSLALAEHLTEFGLTMETAFTNVDGATSQVYALQRSVDAGARKSLLELIADNYRTRPLGYVNFDAEHSQVVIGHYATQTPIALALAAGQIVLTAPGARVVPASKVIAPNGYGLQSTVADAIDNVHIAFQAWHYTRDEQGVWQNVWTNPSWTAPTSRPEGKGHHVLEVNSPGLWRDPEWTEDTVDPNATKSNRFTEGWLMSAILPLVNGFNDQLRMPKVRFDFSRFDYGDAVLVDYLLSPVVIHQATQAPLPLFFPGSVFNRFSRVGPQFQIIGGELRFAKGGWTHDVNLIAATPTGTTVTLAQLVTNATPTLADFDPSITLDDLGTVTQGLA